MISGVKRLSDDTVIYEGDTKITYIRADGYSGIALTCSLVNTSNTLWMRNGLQINFEVANGISVSF